MPYYPQVSSRFTSRLLTVLLLMLAAFGIGGGVGCAVTRFAQIAVCASDEERGEPHRVSEQRNSPPSRPRPIHENISRREDWPRDIFLFRELFQRPPPSLRFSDT
ncbi:MAG TPA: hypothetical protein VGZ73_12935 [Bryobacteraceae bacterium]|jgi:hypothetical protein|nr:hypothetical protein [Bryobacteraceae bacterium]